MGKNMLKSAGSKTNIHVILYTNIQSRYDCEHIVVLDVKFSKIRR